MKILAIVQCWNSSDPVRGFTVGWMERLASQVEQLTVLALEKRHESACPNITLLSLGKERYRGIFRKAAYLLRWHSAMRRIFRTSPPDVIFTHMAPIYSVLAWPYAIGRKIPIVTWFAHRKVTLICKLAYHLSSRVVSISRHAYSYGGDKLCITGHGIDTNLYKPSPLEEAHARMLLCVGRLAPIKNPETLIDAVRLLREQFPDLCCVFIGEGSNRRYKRALIERVKRAKLEQVIRFTGALPPMALLKWYSQCLVHINLSPTGAMDKAALEAMACGRPSLIANHAFKEFLGPDAELLLFKYGDPADLACKLKRLISQPTQDLSNLGTRLHHMVVKYHSLNNLVAKLLDVFRSVTEDKGKHGLARTHTARGL